MAEGMGTGSQAQWSACPHSRRRPLRRKRGQALRCAASQSPFLPPLCLGRRPLRRRTGTGVEEWGQALRCAASQSPFSPPPCFGGGRRGGMGTGIPLPSSQSPFSPPLCVGRRPLRRRMGDGDSAALRGQSPSASALPAHNRSRGGTSFVPGSFRGVSLGVEDASRSKRSALRGADMPRIVRGGLIQATLCEPATAPVADDQAGDDRQARRADRRGRRAAGRRSSACRSCSTGRISAPSRRRGGTT